jgi:cysteinyl-tRNA synthetase
MIYLYNSLSKQKEEFIPINPDHIKFYSCGPTVYNKIHIGNARAFLSADLLSKVLKGIYPKVTYVSNITDIDDKIIEASKHENLPIKDLTKKYFEIYMEDISLIGINPPDIQPFATDFIEEMIAYIEKLIGLNKAYEASGNVLFRVNTFENYGCLSGRKIEEQKHGKRVEVESYKENENDFTLWKPSRKDEPGWNSPWGFGRPGWHLECSVMSEITLDIPFDIHGGGNDLKFPHHENEIAQTCACNGLDKASDFAKYWFHNGFLNLESEKMSKSLGNVIYIKDLLNDYQGNHIRLALLSTQYRQPIPWSKKLLDQAKSISSKINNFLEKHENVKPKFISTTKIAEALFDDLNTPRAIRIMQDFVQSKIFDPNEVATYKYIFEGSTQDTTIDEDTVKLIEELIAQRNQARNDGDYALADKIRDKLSKMNVSIKDVNEKTEWKI